MVVGLGAALSDTSGGDRSLRAHSLMEFASALTRNLTWPFFDAPGMACLFRCPWWLGGLVFRPNFQESRAAELLLELALWSVLQSAALAYGRANYGDNYSNQPLSGRLECFCHRQSFRFGAARAILAARRMFHKIHMFLPLVFSAVIFFGLCRISQIVVDELLLPPA